jgi:hypothetical protein
MTNYTAHLTTGGTLALTFKGRPMNMHGGLALSDEWVIDDNGAMVNMTHVSALVREDAPAVSVEPRRAMDRDGDIWTRQSDGSYDFGGITGYSLDSINEMYGPWTEVK